MPHCPFLLLAFFIGIKVFLPAYYLNLIQEDHVLEWLQVFFYALTGLIFLKIVVLQKSVKKNIGQSTILFILGLMFLCIAAEEVSWGQRILNINIPLFFKQHNTQGELTLHNLNHFQPFLHLGYIAISFYGAFACRIIPRILSQKESLLYLLATPHQTVAYCSFVTFVIYLGYELNRHLHYTAFIIPRDQEVAELFLAIAMLMHARFAFHHLQK